MPVKKCPKCGSVWYSELVNCAFCGVEGELQNMPILTGKVHGERAAERPAPLPAPAAEEAPVAVAEATPVPPTQADTPVPPVAEVKGEPIPEVKLEDPPAPAVVPAPAPVAIPEPPKAFLPPAPRLPSATLPVVFAALGFVAFLVVPAAAYLHYDRVGGILTLLGYGILAPFAPFAWWLGRRYEERCRALGFEPSRAGRAGRAVGTLATFIVVIEASLVAVLMAVLHLAGRLPNLFSR